MTDLLTIIRTRLLTQSVANTTTWPCYIGYTPDLTDQVISLELSGGFPQDTHGNENVHQTFQVRVRAARLDYTACEIKWWAMYAALNDANLSASGIHLIQAMSSAPLAFYDEKERVVMTANFRVIRAYSA